MADERDKRAAEADLELAEKEAAQVKGGRALYPQGRKGQKKKKSASSGGGSANVKPM